MHRLFHSSHGFGEPCRALQIRNRRDGPEGFFHMPDSLLAVRELETHFRTPEGMVHAVNGASFRLNEGETLGMVGESGCGQSVTML